MSRLPADAPDGPRAPGFVTFFVGRPIFAAVVAILITLAGAISVPLLPVSQFPPIAPPTVQVTANYNGASADVVERTVTLPIEDQVNGTEGMIYMASTSANDGQMTMTVTFELGRNQVRWREGRVPPATGAPSASSLAALREALQHAVEPPAQPSSPPQWQFKPQPQPPAEPEAPPAAPAR